MRMLAQALNDFPWAATLKTLGPTGAAMSAVIWALVKGWLITGREAKERAAASEREIKMWQERYVELKTESTSRLDNMRTEKDMWRSQAMRAAKLAEIVASPGGST